MEANWYAVYTKPRWEKKVSELLDKKKIENYCPLNTVIRKWSDRKKKVSEPLFTSYVFVRIPEDQQFQVKQVSGIINLVYWLNKPAVIKDREIQAVREFLDEYKNVRLEKTSVNVNDMVRVLSGPLMEYEGNVIGVKTNTVKIVLPSLGFLMVAEVEKANVEIVKPRFDFHLERSISANYAFK